MKSGESRIQPHSLHRNQGQPWGGTRVWDVLTALVAATDIGVTLDSAQPQLLAGKLQSLTQLMDIIGIRVDAQTRADRR